MDGESYQIGYFGGFLVGVAVYALIHRWLANEVERLIIRFEAGEFEAEEIAIESPEDSLFVFKAIAIGVAFFSLVTLSIVVNQTGH